MRQIGAMNPEKLPVIVAIGEVTDRPADPRAALEPVALMAAAARCADGDGGGGWLARVDSADVVHQRSWRYADTAAQFCAGLGITPARAVYGPYGGESPVRFLHQAAARIADGSSRVALIVSGEAQYARTRSVKEGWTPDWTPLAAREENAFDPSGVVDPLAALQGVLSPAQVYPLFESAWTAAHGETQAQGIAGSAALWARYAATAAANDFAWRRDAPDAGAIAGQEGGNRWIAWPYTKAMVANPDVNQAAALIVTSLAEARRAGIAEERLVHIHRGAFAAEPRNWLKRDSYAHSVAQEAVLRAVQGAYDLYELYSCFPVVPKMAGDVLGREALARPSVAGGLSFFGAPLNSYMTHAATAMVRALRDGRGTTGLLYGQGEYVTKHHALAVGRHPLDGGFAGGGDVQAQADAARGAVPPIDRAASGAATIEAHTVMFDRRGAPQFAAIIARGADGWRTLARSEDAATIARLLDRDTHPVGAQGVVTIDAQSRPEWNFA
ncbi:MAG TPA: acetyl-CoA acetyltransferase [Sphingomonas sp.]|nr:acetyl-CoA acetyltransferase [Sphingomonas sp.]